MTHAQQNWSAVPLVELLSTLETGGRPKGGVRDIADGIPSLGGEHLSYEGKFKFERLKFIPEEFANSLKSGKLSVDDVLVVKDGATTGKTVRVGKDFPFETAYVNEHVYLCRPSRNINSQYITYFLRSDEGQKAILDNFRGAAQGGITKAFAENVLVPVAPLNEQIRIADKLDSVLAKVDAAQARLEKIPTLLKRFRQAVLAAATSGELTREWRETSETRNDFLTWKFSNIPGSWKIKLLPEVSEARLGKMLDKNKNQGVPTRYLGNINVRWGKFDLDDLKEILISEKEREELKIQDGDLLLCEGGEPGRGAVWKGEKCDLTFQKALHRVRFDGSVLPEFALFCIENDYFQNRLSLLYTGTTIKHLTGKALKKYPIPVPPVDEQKEIVRRVESLFTLADTVEKQYLETKKRIDRLTQSLLAKAFRGELVPQDPNDEPAAELLKRIQAERNAQPPMKNKRKQQA
jgi:type I restriction enzyme S subunit